MLKLECARPDTSRTGETHRWWAQMEVRVMARLKKMIAISFAVMIAASVLAPVADAGFRRGDTGGGCTSKMHKAGLC